ncbi:uncharacterized protein LOC131327595 [Rhododendron vialii]|uniref:uncharacterized protein LOC131327595 n=1 Tax=Rhododendron vialii TaxID=182163 RepID=UPI0026600BB9|nr:uncharacterized protein LOC131327595 [Rhododendron vialii]
MLLSAVYSAFVVHFAVYCPLVRVSLLLIMVYSRFEDSYKQQHHPVILFTFSAVLLQEMVKPKKSNKDLGSSKTRGPILRKRIQKQKQQKQVAKRTAVKKQKKKVKKNVKKEVKPKPKQIQYGSSFQSFVKLLKDIKFTTLQKEKIRKMPFIDLIFAVVDESLTEAYLRKSDLHALSLIIR